MFPTAAEILGSASVSETGFGLETGKGKASAVPISTSAGGVLAPAGQDDWESLRSVRDEVLKALEEARNAKLIGGGLEAQVHLTAPDPLYSLLKRYEPQLRYLFIVSAVETQLATSPNGGASAVKVEVKKADGQKCERCWNYSTHVGEDESYPTVCERCSSVLKELA
jgi:isoleucyl-tRNA synthetase